MPGLFQEYNEKNQFPIFYRYEALGYLLNKRLSRPLPGGFRPSGSGVGPGNLYFLLRTSDDSYEGRMANPGIKCLTCHSKIPHLPEFTPLLPS